jgi:hypothetical protein
MLKKMHPPLSVQNNFSPRDISSRDTKEWRRENAEREREKL